MALVNNVIWFAVIDSYNPFTNSIRKLYMTSDNVQPRFLRPQDITVESGDFPLSAEWEPRLKDPGSFEVSMFGDGRTYGTTSSGFGNVILGNADGGLDYLASYGFDGRRVEIYKAAVAEINDGRIGLTIAQWFVGTMEGIEVTYSKNQPSEFILLMRDKKIILDKPIQTLRYLGTNEGPVGIEGTVNDIKDTVKPLAYGEIFNATPITVNTSALVYQLHSGRINSVIEVYDNGVPLSRATGVGNGGDFTDSTALLAAAIPSNSYATCLAEGLIRLGGPSPAGEITVDFEGDATENLYVSTVGAIVQRIITQKAMLDVLDIDLSSIQTLTTTAPYSVGIYINSERTISEVLDEVLSSIGAFGYFNRLGVYTVGRLELPGESYDYLFTVDDLIDIERRPTQDTPRGIPAYQVNLNYLRNFTVQTATALAGAAEERKAFTSLEYRSIIKPDNSVSSTNDVLVTHPLATEIQFQTLLTTDSDAEAEAERRYEIYKKPRDRYIITIRRVSGNYGGGVGSLADAINLNQIVQLKLDRFGLSLGRNFRVLGITEEAAQGTTILDIWGGITFASYTADLEFITADSELFTADLEAADA